MRRWSAALLLAALVTLLFVAVPVQAAEESVHQTDDDFSNATLTNLVISGTGDSAEVELDDATLPGTYLSATHNVSGADYCLVDLSLVNATANVSVDILDNATWREVAASEYNQTGAYSLLLNHSVLTETYNATDTYSYRVQVVLDADEQTTTNESWTVDVGNWTNLGNASILNGSATITNSSGSVMTEGTDYELDLLNGSVKALLNGSLTDNATATATYSWWVGEAALQGEKISQSSTYTYSGSASPSAMDYSLAALVLGVLGFMALAKRRQGG